jgi:hypothetical protein
MELLLVKSIDKLSRQDYIRVPKHELALKVRRKGRDNNG